MMGILNSGNVSHLIDSDRVWFYNLDGLRGTLPSDFGRMSSLGTCKGAVFIMSNDIIVVLLGLIIPP